MSTWSVIRLCAGVITVVLGTLLLLASLPAALIAAGIEGSVGRSGVVSEPVGTLRAAEGDRAVVVDGVGMSVVAPEVPRWAVDLLASVGTDSQSLTERAGDVVLVLQSATGSDLFAGVAPVDAVNDYLDGAAYSVAVRPPPGVDTWPTVSVPGTVIPSPPATQAWSASAEGPMPELPGAALDGGTLVLMRPDAGPGVQAAARLEYRVPNAPLVLESSAITAAASSAGGVALILLGGWLVVGRRRRS